MNEEKEQNNGQAQNIKSALGSGLKKKGKEAAKKFFKTIIVAIVPKLLLAISIVFVIYVLISAISSFLDLEQSKESKTASSSSIAFSSKVDNIEGNKIIASTNNLTADGGYNLQYMYQDEDGNSYSAGTAISDVKKTLEEENEDIDLSKFSNSELKMLGVLINNGLETGKYNEEQLKALALFVKADIAGQSFDLREENDRDKIKLEDLINNDKVYGTLELHKTTATTNDNGDVIYKEIELKFVQYETFQSMIEAMDESVLEKFSINEDGHVVIAKSSTSIIRYSYQYPDGAPLSDSDMARVDAGVIGEDEEEYIIKEYLIPIDYKQYIKKYIASYGFLSDLMLTTNNVNFCLEIAEIAFNSRIVLNIREEQVDTEIYNATNYTQTSLMYDYVSYKVEGYKNTEVWTEVDSGTGSPTDMPEDMENYKLSFSGDEWILSESSQTSELIVTETNNNPEGDLIENEFVSETYDDYSINEPYTRQEIFDYTVIIESFTRNYKYDIDIAKIDCWYLLYDRPYTEPEKNIKEYPQPEDVFGQYPQSLELVPGVSAEAQHVAEQFLEERKQQVLNHPEVTDVEGSITGIVTKKKQKTDGIVANYEGTRTVYEFGDESDLDTTQVEFKNLEYVNGKPSYTPEGKIGLLYIYDQYIQKSVDLCLQNDAEKEFFAMLEEDLNTYHVSEIMKFLLYVYDGIDRGVIDLDKKFEIIDMSLTTYYGIVGTAFGCTISRDEFITAAQNYGESILAGLAPQFYDICSKYNINPCVAYGWAALESGWGRSAVNDKNLFQMGSYNGSTSGFTYPSYEAAIEDFCQWILAAADPSTSSYAKACERSQEYATVNNKFNGKPENNIYVLFSRYSWVGYTHEPNARACIRNTYEFLNDGIYECNHSDSDETTLKERADYVQYTVELRLKVAEDVFGEDIFLGASGNYQEAGASSGGTGVQAGTYQSSSGRQYVEWIQGQGEISQKPLHDGRTMGQAGCGVFACATLVSSLGIEPDIGEVYKAYRSCGGWSPSATMDIIMDNYGVSGSVNSAGDEETFVSVLNEGKGVMAHVGSGYNQLYTSNMHWIVATDIRDSQLGSSMGYDVYVLTSGGEGDSGHGWQPMETIWGNLKSRPYYYIDDN